MRRSVVGVGAIVAVVAAVAVLASGVLAPAGGPGSTPTPLPPIAVSDRVVAEARAIPRTWAAVEAAVPGTVDRVAVLVGARVTAGATLVELDATVADAETASAEAALDAATARATQVTAAARQAAAEVDRAAAAVRGARASRNLLPSGASSARERLGDADVDAALAGLASAKASRDAANAAVTAAQADQARASAAVEAAHAAADRLVVRAPIDGTIADVSVSVGDTVAPGPALVRIAGDGAWTFETTDVTQDSVAVIEVGNAARVTVDGFAGVSIPGRVTRIAAFGVDRQGDVVFTVVVEPDGAVPAGIRWNMQASIEIATKP